MVIQTTSYPRAGLIGNPSDGYHGKTIAFIVRNFSASVNLWQSPELEIQPARRDEMVFGSLGDLVEDTDSYGYYGGLRLLKASVKRFHDHCTQNGLSLHDRNFTIRYRSDIPPHVGMAGSSAIITACVRALMEFYEIQIPAPVLANLVLSVETDELLIPAGLQDRVVQAYEGLVFMDFAKKHFEEMGHGVYEELDLTSLPDLYIAYSPYLSENTEIFHNDIRGRFDRGEPAVIDAMAEWATLAQQARDLLSQGKGQELGPLLNRNFDLRKSIYHLSQGNLDMIEAARSAGASAKFTGSGGAIVGIYEGEEMFERLVTNLTPLGIKVLKPIIAPQVT
ncbi:MAG TPA: GHMP kinase [Verrucomicrobiales bacterium]|nr:GHMP kinase [Verrucomicrobiales bacterium]